jgi:hypothetical protein
MGGEFAKNAPHADMRRMLINHVNSFKKNIKILEREAKAIIDLGKEYYIDFDIAKTELIHFFISPKQTPSLTLPNGIAIQASRLVK